MADAHERAKSGSGSSSSLRDQPQTRSTGRQGGRIGANRPGLAEQGRRIRANRPGRAGRAGRAG
ncbi:MAG: hypothetical protein M3422_13405, partial [Actinomycetota bacterium]|nr:hypothetical protein [Actinomycetota bacterium]